jgi:TRAP-type C4-dicarboxylate transport system permease small subunit
MDTDDIWIIVALVVSMGLVAVLLVIDLYRVIDASAPESKGDG